MTVNRPPDSASTTPLSPSEIFNGARILLLGGTGFLGKVTLSMLLHRFPNIGRVYLMVRAPSAAESESRFWSSIVASPPFEPLRERYGAAFEDLIRAKVRVVGGDIGDPNLGLGDEEAQRIADDVHVVVNSAGKVTFNPALEAALRTNVTGMRNLIAFAKRMPRPALVHTSTCFVAGNRSGTIWEDEPLIGYFPRRGEMPGVEFSAEREIADCEAIFARVREETRDAMTIARLTQQARAALEAEGRDADDPAALSAMVGRERKAWTRARLTELGIERAAWWGWPNIYTYTKSLGEQLIAAETAIVRSIVRPSIIESALAYPFAGWNEGMTTTAPLILMSLKGQVQFPAADELLLDITPVDSVAAVLLAVTAEACVREPRLVYQAATSDTNPLPMRRVVELGGLHKRRRMAERTTGLRPLNTLLGAMEATTVSVERFERTSTPMLNAASRAVSSFLGRVRPQLGDGRLGQALDVAKAQADRVEEVTRETRSVIDMFRPFVVENRYLLRAENVRRLFAEIREEERPLLRWEPERIDWYRYWLDVHLPGLEDWVFPKLEEELLERPRRVHTHRDLVELFDSATARHAKRIAMRIERDGVTEQYTYANLQEVASRAAGFLAANGIAPGDRILLVSHNAPGWGMAYFGVLKAGATCVPTDAASTVEDILRLVCASDAVAVLLGEEVAGKHPDLTARLRDAGHEGVRVWRLAQLFALPDERTERERIALLPTRTPGHTPASILFTSGTTGEPKGVMLTHRNLSSSVSMLSSVFALGPKDGVLSVLPLHHAFEFSAGFLMPLAHGAQITYLAEVSREELLRALKRSHVTAMVGVPALWESLHRRITGDIRERGPWVERLAHLLSLANGWLRDRTPVNPGSLLFAPIHRELGGRLRLLISGGAPLSEAVKRDLHGLGFTILEGYGLTEASPVLTVTRPQNRLQPLGVGTPLPGVEVRIASPDASGVGEVIARGGNIMSGYYRNDEATRRAIINGWLHTGDLGRMDERGNLYLVGRSKEIIVDADGRNVYPDELEEVYGGSPFIKELCILGVSDGGSEKVACVIVPAYEHDASLSPAAVRERVETHVRELSLKLPYHKRIKALHFTDEPLPRTPTRKVRRSEVAAALQEHGRRESVDAVTASEGPSTIEDTSWLIEIIATVCNRPRNTITPDTKLEALGFDSLMYVELAIALEEAGATTMATNELFALEDVRHLARAIAHHGTQPRRPSSLAREERPPGELRVPPLLRAAGVTGLGMLQRVFYEAVLDTTYEGRVNVPVHTNFIVAANHSSHLDMGLAKLALGEQGRDIVALAAADYFFDNRYKRAYVENFTNLVPIERSGSLRKSLRHALDFLSRGHNVLIFPEGTRTVTGAMAEFKPIVGFLALSARVGILPVYLHGTYEALPKGSALLRSRTVGARIGRFLSIEYLEGLTSGMPASAANRMVAALVRHEVVALRDGASTPFDAAAFRSRASIEPIPAEEHEEEEEPRPVDHSATVGD